MGRSLLLDKNTGHYRQPESLGKQAEGITNRGKTSTPGSPLTNFNDGGRGGLGGPTEVHILYPKKSQVQNLFIPKNPFVLFLQPKKALCSFLRPK